MIDFLNRKYIHLVSFIYNLFRSIHSPAFINSLFTVSFIALNRLSAKHGHWKGRGKRVDFAM